MTAVTVGIITVARLWTRPLGALASGWLGDALQRERVLAALLVSASLSLAGVLLLPAGAGIPLTLSIVLLTGLLTFGVRGIYWATLETCDVPVRSKGLAIGVISLIAYLPDIYLPLINGALLTRFPGNTGYAIYFSGLALFGLLGATAAWRLSTNNANVRR
jgi:sugar phosphate permease